MSTYSKTRHSTREHGEPNMKHAIQYRPAIQIGLVASALLALGAGAAFAHGGGGGVEMELEGAPSFSIPPVYHILVVHFPIALWLTAALFIFFRVFSDSQLAVRLQKSVWPLILLGSFAGLVAYGLGLSIYPWSAITQSPLGRNHIMLATWTLSYWTVLGVLGYRYRRHLFEGAQRWVTFVLTLIGATVVTITGTLGGSLNGTPSLVTKTLGKVGWEVYMTFYLPTWMLWAFGLGAVAIVTLGVLGRRSRA
ncbi:hypothetical protein SAMN05444851_1712 [Aliiroseovarius sediminilitoris]|uniref:DUF2231 domain-containing protein n=2 Tax=Aliiroseovarius sediminilitoris TaxID=1173584 RepID=A0A1I0PKP8_9RHOB|nr:hypothetical protein SAMN05444851_1712 [Aliiroseovarius sediminilitoris]